MPSAATIVACALALLGRSEATLPPIVLVDAIPIEASARVEAFVRPFDDRIHLLTTSPVFREAQIRRSECGDSVALKKLASIIIHEEWHVRHGPDERGAYEAQLSTLLRLNVQPGSALYGGVTRSMLAVLKKRNQKPEMVLAARRGADDD
jgi:hypothetical protein